jgi:hypothetical protein
MSSALTFCLASALSCCVSASVHGRVISPSARAAARVLTGLLGLRFFGRTWGPSSFPGQPLCLKTLPVGMERLLIGLVLSHCLFGLDFAECLPRFALCFGGRFESFNFARCLCHFFTFSPSSTRRRMASDVLAESFHIERFR